MNSKFSLKRLFMSWHMWVMLAIIVGAILLQGSLGFFTLLLALFLVCPILMMFMMGDSHSSPKHKK